MRRKLGPLWLGLRGRVMHALSGQRAAALPPDAQIKRILVIRRDRLGDLVFTSAIFQPLTKLFPEATIEAWVRPELTPLLQEHPHVHRVWDMRPPNGNYDMVIDPVLDYPVASARLAASFKARWTSGFDVAGRGYWFTLPITPPDKDEPFLNSLGRLLAPLGFTGQIQRPILHASQQEKEQARALLGYEEPFMVIHPGAYYPSQRWPAEYFAVVTDALLSQGYPVVLLGGKADEDVIQDIRECMRPGVGLTILCDQPLRMVMALMSEAWVVVCNNSGPLHLASTLGTTTVSTLGPTNPVVWWPAGMHQSVLVAPDCEHCERGDCRRQCLRRISPEQALREVQRMMAEQT